MRERNEGVGSMQDVIIVGAGPVGISLALALGRAGVAVTLIEREEGLPKQGRATTIHASTLELLDELGVAEEAVAAGIPARTLQYRDYTSGETAEFDFSVLSRMTKFPFRLQLEQNQLCAIMLEALEQYPNVRVIFSAEVINAAEKVDGVDVSFLHEGVEQTLRGAYLVGADGAHSRVREIAEIGFEGSTYPFTMLTLSTFKDIREIVEGAAPVTYVFDSERAMAFLRIKDHWRISLNTISSMPTEHEALKDAIVDMASTGLGYEFDRERDVKSINIHRIHQRVAEEFATRRIVLAGDAAHINSPTGGMGMNSGIHDSCALFPFLVAGLNGEHSAALFDEYNKERKRVAVEVVGFASDQNTKDMFASERKRRERIRELQKISSDEESAIEFLRGSTLLDASPGRESLRIP